MSEETPSFQPHSDEDLARLLEEQMRILRSEAPASQPVAAEKPAEVFTPLTSEPAPEPAFSVPVAEELPDSGIDELFGALLEDTSDVAVVREETVELFQPVVNDEDLELTQPIPTLIHEEVVEVAEVDDHVVMVEETTDVVVEDAHVVAERVISAISLDGDVVAASVMETEWSEPIPSMFGDVEPIPAVIPAPVVADVVEPVTSVVDEQITFVEEETFAVEISAPVENTVTSFGPRPSFDELVFGFQSEQ